MTVKHGWSWNHAKTIPFLASFYGDQERFAFPAQMFYLASRFSQQMNLRQLDLFSDLIVSDYLWEKDRLFAEETLHGNEKDLYDRFSDLLQGSIEQPDFVVFLDSPTEVVRSRIAEGEAEGEHVIGADYLDSLRERYYSLWARYTAAPVYVIDTSEIHYVDSDADKDYMLRLIDGWIAGTPFGSAPLRIKHPAANVDVRINRTAHPQQRWGVGRIRLGQPHGSMHPPKGVSTTSMRSSTLSISRYRCQASTSGKTRWAKN